MNKYVISVIAVSIITISIIIVMVIIFSAEIENIFQAGALGLLGVFGVSLLKGRKNNIKEHEEEISILENNHEKIKGEVNEGLRSVDYSDDDIMDGLQ